MSSLSFRVEWSADDGEWVGLCEEFPSLSWLAPSPEGAHDGIAVLARQVAYETELAGEVGA